MVSRPVFETPGATDMLYCLTKFEIANYARPWISGAAASPDNPYELITSTGAEVMASKKKMITKLEKFYYDNYTGYCDPIIPLHHISTTVAQLTIHRLRFQCSHPRNCTEGSQQMSQADQDMVCESSLRLLQLDHDMHTTNTPHICSSTS